MNRLNALIRTPDVPSLAQAPQRAPLCLLAAAALCARNALTVQHRDAFECAMSEGNDEVTPPAMPLVAFELAKRIDALLRSLRLYDACLRDHELANQNDPDFPF